MIRGAGFGDLYYWCWRHIPLALMTPAAKQKRWLDHFEWEAIERGRYPATERRHIRRLTDERLHELVAGQIEEKHRLALDRELKRRDAWDAPAGRAYRLSWIALGVSVASFVWSVVG